MVRTKTVAAKGKGKATTSGPEQAEDEDEDKDDAKISSKIGKVPIEVTSGFIARLLNYRQPSASNVNYPNEEYVADDTIVRELYKNPGEASLPHVPGRFKDVYRLVNQLNVPKSKFEEREKLNPGDINSSILTRSISQSRPATVAAPRGAYLTTLPPKGARAASWNKLLFCQGVAIMGCMKKIKKETRDNARRQRRIDHKLDWVVSQGQGQASEPYEPPPMEPDKDSDDFAGGEPEAWFGCKTNPKLVVVSTPGEISARPAKGRRCEASGKAWGRRVPN
ncbi:hypothetical protein RHSIM_Rhsim04G0242500 [Rhododendron simsii]|uniref:Uncharacterized protein n=1 Tax=Rhododendron simsii TaxID=118357 RepID=A0A834GZ49_RHOSS|nr:hypothetical protein RHSIM_Rhsim04G0242500 [Rhododendron simsii]